MGGRVRTLVLLGNHDKEIFADDATLALFYEQCLGQPVETLSDDYRRWIGQMYFDDVDHYLDPERKSVPWLPFYWGDQGFRLFVTHGQWRDQDNSRRITPKKGRVGWQVKDGWRLDIWRSLHFAPFTQPCFGDTVACGLLSGFIYRSKERLRALPTPTAIETREVNRLKIILEELDLYRPTPDAIKRIIQETRRLRRLDIKLANARKIIEDELLNSVCTWLSWDFTYESASTKTRGILRVSKPILKALKRLSVRIALGFLYEAMALMSWLQRSHRDTPSYDAMQRFPAFLTDYREFGLRIHCEGHTHTPLQEELYFQIPVTPKNRQNYTYINLGTWRDQLIPKKMQGYRRRSVGRTLVVLDKLTEGSDGRRSFAYWTQDILTWGDKADRLE